MLWRCGKVCALALEKVWETMRGLVGSARAGLFVAVLGRGADLPKPPPNSVSGLFYPLLAITI